MKRFTHFFLLLLLVLSFGSRALHAQATASGNIQGTVTDKTQAVVSGATVEVTSKATGTARTALTSDAGYYRFEFLPVGTYQVKISKAGFTSATANVELLVGQTATFNLELAIGKASEIIEVTSEVPLIDQAKTSVSETITPTEVQQLPMIGRDVANLAYLAPGVRAADSYDPTKNRYAILSVDGMDGRNINVTINGVDNKDNTVGGPVMQLPLESVQEFVIGTQRYSALNGRSEGAAINMITKSGTNQWHGSLYGGFRAQQFDSLNYFEKPENGGSGQKSSYSRQVYSGSVGGPIIKDKLFGFFAFERQQEHTSLTESPDAYNALVLAEPIGADPAQVIPTPFFENRFNARIDYTINAKNTAYVSVSTQSNNSNNDQSDGLGDLTGGNFTKNHLQIGNFTVNSVLSPTWFNSFTFGYQYWNNIIDSNDRVPYVTFPGGSWFGTNANVPQQSYQRKFQFKDDLNKTFGRHNLKFGVDYIYNPLLGGFFESNSTLELDFKDDPSVILANPSTCGSAKDQPCYPDGFSSPGAVVGMSASVGDPYFNMPGGTKQLGLYFQDDWKATRRLTLNLGLRWDKDFNLVGGSAIQNSRTYQELQAIGSPYAHAPSDANNDFSPRIGFAYDITGQGKHIINGGFGLYFGNIFQNIPLFMIQQANATIYQGVFSITGQGPLSPCTECIVPGTGIPLSDWRYGVDPYPTIPSPSGTLATGATGRLMDPNYVNPVTEQFNVGYQWAVTNNISFETAYVHVLGLHQNKTVNINPTEPILGTDPDTGDPIIVAAPRPLHDAFVAAGVPALGRVMDEQSVNRSRYDGINFSYRQRMTHHFTLNANYTLSWARGWDVNTNGTAFRNYPHDPLNIWDPLDFGYTPQDERNHITISGVVDLPWGIQVAPILQFGSARPYDLTSSFDVLDRGSGYSRPVVVPNSNTTDYAAFSDAASALACLQASQCRQVGYDTARGSSFFQLDARFSKNFNFKERFNLQLFFQAFNLTNHTNFGNNYSNVAGSANFGTPAGFINPSSTMIPRAFSGEFGFKFNF